MEVITIVITFTQMIKSLNWIDTKYLPWIAVLLGISGVLGANTSLITSATPETLPSLVVGLIGKGIVMGIISTGGFSAVKEIAKKVAKKGE